MHVCKWCRSLTLHLAACKHDSRGCEAMRSILVVRAIWFLFWRLIATVWIARFLYACWRRVWSLCSWLKSLLLLWEPESGRLWSYEKVKSVDNLAHYFTSCGRSSFVNTNAWCNMQLLFRFAHLVPGSIVVRTLHTPCSIDLEVWLKYIHDIAHCLLTWRRWITSSII